jgi:hypothetical protein
VTGYPQFFYGQADGCTNNEHFFPDGAILTPNLRQAINNLVIQMNNVLAAAIATVQSGGQVGAKQIKFFSDLDGLYEGHRFCDPANANWDSDSWFFTIASFDVLPNGVQVPDSAMADPTSQSTIELKSYGLTCNQTQFDDSQWADQVLCNYAVSLVNGGEDDPDLPDLVLPWWIMKALHPKSIGGSATGNAIFNRLRTLPVV